MTKQQFLNGQCFRGHIPSLSDVYCFDGECILKKASPFDVYVASVSKVTDKYITAFNSIVHIPSTVRISLDRLSLVHPDMRKEVSNV